MNCPNCAGTSMTRLDADGFSVDRCPTCHGIWLDPLELEQLLRTPPRSLVQDDRRFTRQPGSPDANRLCPACQRVPLVRLNSLAGRGTIIDSCPVCFGNFLDAGELAQLSDGPSGRLSGVLRAIFGI